ncbi:DUF2574 family protein [Salmonella enterica subsp. enterica]|nr:DUF2574 family protein [Salmonella enterica subsp. enterica]
MNNTQQQRCGQTFTIQILTMPFHSRSTQGIVTEIIAVLVFLLPRQIVLNRYD